MRPLETPNLTLASVNPATYAATLTTRDPALDVAPADVDELAKLNQDPQMYWFASHQYGDIESRQQDFTEHKQSLVKSTTPLAAWQIARRAIYGLLAQTALALFCLGLVAYQWRRLRAETLLA